MNLTHFSQQTKQEADALLLYGNVTEVLSKYGKVVVTGSYKYDLMYDPDIDLVVLCDNPEKNSYQAFLDFINDRKFQKYQLGDFKKFPHKNRPHDIIVVLIHEYKGRRWEIEVWFKESLSDDQANLEKLILQASDEQKRIVLELKKQRDTAHISKNQLSSTTIYTGVFLEGKTVLEDFKLDLL